MWDCKFDIGFVKRYLKKHKRNAALILYWTWTFSIFKYVLQRSLQQSAGAMLKKNKRDFKDKVIVIQEKNKNCMRITYNIRQHGILHGEYQKISPLFYFEFQK